MNRAEFETDLRREGYELREGEIEPNVHRGSHAHEFDARLALIFLVSRARACARLKNSADSVLRHATGLPISIADEPLTCVALGAGRVLEEMQTLKNVMINML